MREIKFRAWDSKNKHMWGSEDIGIMGGRIMFNAQLPCKEDDLEIMQYTGLHDESSKEIFEGDIVELEEPIMESDIIECVIVFYEGSFCAEWDRGSTVSRFPLSECRIEEGNVKIIGNIYKNQTLLKDKKDI